LAILAPILAAIHLRDSLIPALTAEILPAQQLVQALAARLDQIWRDQVNDKKAQRLVPC
jgi:hypothetical protein